MVPTGNSEDTPCCYRRLCYIMLITLGGTSLGLAAMVGVLIAANSEGSAAIGLGVTSGVFLILGLALMIPGIYSCKRAGRIRQENFEQQRTEGPTVVGYNPGGFDGPGTNYGTTTYPSAPPASGDPPPYMMATKN